MRSPKIGLQVARVNRNIEEWGYLRLHVACKAPKKIDLGKKP